MKVRESIDELAVLCRSGDEMAWGRLYKVLRPFALIIGRRYFRYSETVLYDFIHDAATEAAFVVVKVVDCVEPLRALARTVIRQRAYKVIRDSLALCRRHDEVSLDVICPEGEASKEPGPERVVVAQQRVEAYLKRLPRCQREALVMRYCTEVDLEHFTQEWGTTPRQTSDRFVRMRRRVRKHAKLLENPTKKALEGAHLSGKRMQSL